MNCYNQEKTKVLINFSATGYDSMGRNLAIFLRWIKDTFNYISNMKIKY